MRWLLHGTLGPPVADALAAHGHTVTPAADLGLSPDAEPADVLAAARRGQVEVVTDDRALVDAATDPAVGFARAIAYLRVESDADPEAAAPAPDPAAAVARLLARYPRPGGGRLYTVGPARVRVRQLPG